MSHNTNPFLRPTSNAEPLDLVGGGLIPSPIVRPTSVDPAHGAIPDPPVLPPTPSPKDDPFDIERARVPQDFSKSAAVKRHLTEVMVDKPSSETFFRIHAGGDFQMDVRLFRIKEGAARGFYWIDPKLVVELTVTRAVAKKIQNHRIFTGITHRGQVFLWPISGPGPDGVMNPWHASALEAALLAQTRWTRIEADMNRGGYDVATAEAELPEPNWPDKSLQELITLGFRHRLIDTLDHPIIRQLRGLE
jgi:hypothetical protein